MLGIKRLCVGKCHLAFPTDGMPQTSVILSRKASMLRFGDVNKSVFIRPSALPDHQRVIFIEI